MERALRQGDRDKDFGRNAADGAHTQRQKKKKRKGKKKKKKKKNKKKKKKKKRKRQFVLCYSSWPNKKKLHTLVSKETCFGNDVCTALSKNHYFPQTSWTERLTAGQVRGGLLRKPNIRARPSISYTPPFPEHLYIGQLLTDCVRLVQPLAPGSFATRPLAPSS